MDIYAQNILDHYKNPRNKEALTRADLAFYEKNQSCGDELTVFLKLSGQKISTIKYLGQGCAISQASISILSEKLVGDNVAKVLKYKFTDIIKILGVPISERRENCAMLGLRAIQKAIDKSSC
ncbi:MAG: iron-sulfur cluster assembly scaffold protein [Patescibacteria group bacterium]